MRISGSGTIQGGRIEEEVITSGSGRIKGDLECDGFRSSGSLSSTGGILSHGNIKTSGSFHIDGNIYGDADAKFSGSATVSKEVVLQGYLSSSGTFRAGSNVNAPLGVSSSGTTVVSGDLTSDKIIEVSGRGKIKGNVKGEDISIGSKVQIGRPKKFWSRIDGSVEARNRIELINTKVFKNVVGRNIMLRSTAVYGTVFYVDNLEIGRRVSLDNEPVKISEEDLKIIIEGD